MESSNTKYFNSLVVVGLSLVLLVILVGFQPQQNPEASVPSGYYSMKDSIVNLINDFKEIRKRSWTSLERFEYKTDFNYMGQANFIRHKLSSHQEDLRNLLADWNEVDHWQTDSSRVQSRLGEIKMEINSTIDYKNQLLLAH